MRDDLNDIIHGILTIIGATLFVVAFHFLTSCTRTEYVTLPPEIHTQYVSVKDTVRDSIYHDVFHEIITKGDTVFDTKTEMVYVDRWRNHTDTIIKNDSVPVPYPVEKKLTKWQQTSIDWFGKLMMIAIALLALVIILAQYIIRKII